MTHHELSLPSSGAQGDLTRGSVFFVGTATVILRYAGFTILTDPNFLHARDHVHLGCSSRRWKIFARQWRKPGWRIA
jgi:hypothetical protein